MARKKAEDVSQEAHDAAGAFKPGKTPAVGSEEYEGTVNSMRDRIVHSYLAATPHEHMLGEQFYPHDAHGAAQAMAGGVNPDSAHGQMLRRTGGKTRDEWGHADIESNYGNRPEWAASAHAAHDFLSSNRDKMRTTPGSAEADAAFKAKRSEPEHAERVHRAAGVLAQTSPQTPWDLNVTQAHEAFHMHEMAPHVLGQLQSGDSKDPDNWDYTKGKWSQRKRQILHENGPDEGKTMALHAQPVEVIKQAHDIAMNGKPERYVANDDIHRVKIGSFQNNIENPHGNNVTVDFRAHDIAEGMRLPTSAEHGLSANKKSKSRDEQGRRYDMLEEAHHRAAAYVNQNHADRRIGANPVDGKTIQAVTWWADRNDQKGRDGGVANTGIGADRSGSTPIGQAGRADLHGEPNQAAGRHNDPAAQLQSIHLAHSKPHEPEAPSPKRAYDEKAPKNPPRDRREHKMGPASPDRLAQIQARKQQRGGSSGWTPTSAV